MTAHGRFRMDGNFKLAPIARAIALVAVAGGTMSSAHAQRAFSPAWFGAMGAAQSTAAQTGLLPNGKPVSSLTSPLAQQQQANAQLQKSINNLNLAAQAIASQQAAQAAARQAAANNDPSVPDGLADGGLKVDTNSLTAGWINANKPTQTSANGKTTVDIQQTADKAILNWETFNVGKNTIVQFDQQSQWAVLNRVNDPMARPSQIQGQIKADGTVMIVNRNGIIFSGTSQVNTHNLVAAAANITDSQFTTNGIYGVNQSTPSFTDANGKLVVAAGAQITTNEPTAVTEGGGYVLLMGQQVSNAGQITADQGQAELAAGDSFIIRKGVGTTTNAASTTRGNEISPQLAANSTSGQVVNTGLLMTREGDITLAGHDVQQNGVAFATTTVDTRGTIHLLNSATDATGNVTLGANATTLVAIEDDGVTTALDSQRAALIADSAAQDLVRAGSVTGAFNNLSAQTDRRDESRIEIVSGNDVDFDGGSLTLATGGQIAVSATHRAFVADQATLDVSGAVGVNLAMASNNVQVNVQGNELRDSPDNRDSGALFNSNVWIDRRDLIFVPAGTGGDTSDRWYTAGGLLEVSGYLDNQGHSIGEWAAQGGTIQLTGSQVVTQTGSNINLSGGSYNVQTGEVAQTWLRGADGNIYNLDSAPSTVTYTGVYVGFEADHPRWGDTTTENFGSPLIAPQMLLQNGYTVGRDAGQLIVNAPTAVMEGDIDTTVYNGPAQNRVRDAISDGYLQAQTAVAKPGSLFFEQYGAGGVTGVNATDIKVGDVADVTSSMSADDALPDDRINTTWLDASRLNAQALGELDLMTSQSITIDAPLTLANGGVLNVIAPIADIAADITARSGSITITNILPGAKGPSALQDVPDGDTPHATLESGVTLDTRGLWVNGLLDPDDTSGLAYLDGGSVKFDSTQDVTIAKGSVIDVSSGGAILPNGKTQGGTGGNVTLVAGDPITGGSNGVLTLDGTIHADGVNGGGTLTISAPGTVLIGDDATLSGGQLVLAAGTAAHTNLVLSQPITIAAGTPLPMAFSQTLTTIALDTPTTIPIQAPSDLGTQGIVLTGDWESPPGTGNIFGTAADGSSIFTLGAHQFHAGDRIVAITGTIPVGTVFPSSAWPQPVPAGAPYTISEAAGSVQSTATTYAAGTVVPAGTVFDQAVSILPVTTFDPKLFQSGFSSYVVNGGSGVLVPEGVDLNPIMPVYQFTADSRGIATGADPADGLAAWQPPLFLENPANDTVTQRGGASITLRSTALVPGTNGGTSGGAIVIPGGASIMVDPGQNITLDAFGQITVEGSLIAHGGSISIINEADGSSEASRNFDAAGAGRGTSIWIGDGALLDVSGEAHTALDGSGHAYGTVTDGGSIRIGGVQGTATSGGANSTTAFVLIRPGAELNADGAQITIDPAAGTDADSSPLTVASNGGSIAFDSFDGIYMDGSIHAFAGGAGAGGGSLSVRMDAPAYPTIGGTIVAAPGGIYSGVMTIVQSGENMEVDPTTGLAVDKPLPDDLAPGSDLTGLALGRTTVSADRIAAGGFDNVALNSHDYMVFAGDVSLHVGQSLSLTAGAIVSAMPNPTVGATPPRTDNHVVLSAPYVELSGPTTLITDNTTSATIGNPTAINAPTDATFEIDADQIDVKDTLVFSASAFFTRFGAATVSQKLPGFADVILHSDGDIRFLAADLPPHAAATTQVTTSLATSWNMDLIADQVYPATGARATVVAGQGNSGTFDDGSLPTLSIQRNDDVTPDMPLSVLGFLDLVGPVIRQGGVVRAPDGRIDIGPVLVFGDVASREVYLLPGSVTSISADGLVVPYGGTTDGLNYNYDGGAANPFQASQANGNGAINLQGIKVDVQDGAVLDMSGGGTVAGAAFISGRGGSIDVLNHPLVDANPTTTVSKSSDKVYAIIPGYGSNYAPNNAETGAGEPGVGQRITIPAGVPGLPAGTYTLLPSNYALLPGAYRVEIGKAATTPLASGASSIGNGTYAVTGRVGIANTDVVSALPSTLLITSGQQVRSLAQYNEETFTDFLNANVGSLSNTANFALTFVQPADGKTLNISLLSTDGAVAGPGLSFAGVTRFTPAAGGASGSASVSTGSALEIYAGTPTDGFTGTVLDDDTVNNLGAPKLKLTGNGISVQSGATVKASEITLNAGTGDIDIGQGATLTTIGMPALLPTGEAPLAFTGTTLFLSNNVADISSSTGTGNIKIESGASLFAGGTLAFATNGATAIDTDAHFGARDIALAVNAINVGDPGDIAAAGNPAGTVFDQALFDFLIAGDPTHGGPQLESLTLSAGKSINIFGNASLDASGSGIDLVLSTPAIYGYGDAGDVATIAADKITWNGATAGTPPAILPGGAGTGSGTLNLAANEIDFGTFKVLDNSVSNRAVYGFGTVNLTATEQIVSVGNSTLAVFQAPSTAADAVLGQNGTGGNLNLVTPMLTGVQGSIIGYVAGGDIAVTAPNGVAPSTASTTLAGAEIDLTAQDVAIDTAVVLPSGKLAVNATNNIVLGSDSRIDLSGQASQIQDATVHGFGGTAIFGSASGNITQDAGSQIDISASQANAGSVTATADQGTVSLNGTLKGSADDAFVSGDFAITSATLADFDALNAKLDDGGFFDARGFDVKQGDLVIGDGVKARNVTVSVDNGSLTVDGTIDASGFAPGIIRLAGKNGLTIASSGVLDAHGTVLQVDSYGNPIEASNRGKIELDASQGKLTLASGATMDVSAPDGVARGDIELNAQRVSETGGDIDIDASGTVNIKGALSIAVNGFWTYTPTDTYGTIVQDNGAADGAARNGDGWLGMDQIDAFSQTFINNALANASLQGRLSGLKAYGAAYHLRPGVEIDSATPNGTLTVAGDIDLSGFRYGPDADRNPLSPTYGRGEPGALVLRAGGDIDIVGSISDGFAAAPKTPDDSGWTLVAGAQKVDVETLLPIVLNPGTTIPNTAGLSLRYDIPIAPAVIKANTAIPAQVTLASSFTVPAGTKLAAPIYDAAGNLLYDKGTVFSADVLLSAGTQLGQGTVLPGTVNIAAMTWPAGANLGVFTGAVSLAGNATVPFEGIIPDGANVVMANATAPTRAADASGDQGSLFAIAPMLPAGDMSWSLRLVAGADLDAADTRTVKSPAALKASGVSGNLTLVDGHHATRLVQYFYYYYPDGTKLPTKYSGDPSSNPYCSSSGYCVASSTSVAGTTAPSVLRTGTGDLDLIAGGSFSEQTLFGVYTAGTQSAPVTAPDGSNPFNQPRSVGANGLPVPDPDKAAAVAAAYAAWYPEHGGDVLLSAQGNASGLIANRDGGDATSRLIATDGTANWLWRQGGGGLGAEPTAWWINFGTYAQTDTFLGDSSFVGFQGIGTMGGGNLTVVAGTADPTSNGGTGLNLAIGSTGRVLADGTVVETGGGNLTLKIASTLNGGDVADLRGDISIRSGSVGTMSVGSSAGITLIDPRSLSPDEPKFAAKSGGVNLVPGDGTISIETRGDVVLGGVTDAGTNGTLDVNAQPYTIVNPDGTVTSSPSGGVTKFTLWTPTTAISLFSAGGDVGSDYLGNTASVNGGGPGFLPGTLSMVAANGDVRFQGATDVGSRPSIELLPSPVGQLQILAAGSVYGEGQTIAMSGASMDSLATPLHAWFSSFDGDNSTPNSDARSGFFDNTPIAFGPDTATGDLHAGDSQPALVYAGNDITDLQIGFDRLNLFNTGSFVPDVTNWYVAAKPFRIIAGRDIVGDGDSIGAKADVFFNDTANGVTLIRAGRDIIYQGATIVGGGVLDVEAGRNLNQGFYGTLESVGPQFGVNPNSLAGGADIVAMAGVGKNGPDYSDFANQYLNPANAADPSKALADQPGKSMQSPDTITTVHDLAGWLKSQFGYGGDDAGALAFFNALPAGDRAKYPSDPTLFAWLKTQGYTGDQGDALADYLGLSDSQKSQFTYNAMLYIWLQQRYNYTGTQAGAYSYFTGLTKEQQGVFIRPVYYDELTEGGREFNDPTSGRFQSYLRGKDAIAALFPVQDASGNPITYTGNITMFSGTTTSILGVKSYDGGMRTDFGGNIQILNPGGQTLVGTEGVIPGSLAGIMTQGEGDIDIYSEGSILLGQSRILTTFGGDILAWSAEGDINSGRGSKTTIIFSPPRRVYDDYGDVTLSPPVPSSGAGIGTLAPIAGIPPGNVDLIAPLGTIDAGEAGIRVSGNINLAALQVVNAANIQVQGKSTGLPVVAVVNVGALTNASAAAAQATIAAQDVVQGERTAARQALPSVFTVRVLGFGSESPNETPSSPPASPALRSSGVSYDRASPVQLIGVGESFDAGQLARLSDSQRRRLKQQER